MGNRKLKGGRRIIWAIWMVWLTAVGCSDPATKPSVEYLIKVNDRSISVDEFNGKYDTVSAEFPTSLQADPEAEKKIKLRLLNQLTEELILLERAEELNMVISDQDLEGVIKGIQADYPEGEFERVLLEQAISYNTWKAELRIRLLKEKVVRDDLEASVVLTPEEILASYETHYRTGGGTSEQESDTEDIDAKVVKLVRRQKAEGIYQTWINDLQKKYIVDINETAWENLGLAQK